MAMALKTWLIFITTELVTCTSNICPKENLSKKYFNASCIAEPRENLCLACPVERSATSIVWSKNGEIIFNQGYQLRRGNYNLNNCHSTFRSLEVLNVGVYQHQDEFTCSSNKTSKALSKFTVVIEARTTLQIQEIKNASFGTKHKDIFLKCVLEKSFGNVTLKWAINGAEVPQQAYYHENGLDGMYISVIRYRTNGGSENVTCTSSGTYIQNETVSWVSKASGNDLRTVKDSQKSTQTVIIVTMLLSVFGVAVVLYYFKRRSAKSTSKSSNEKAGSSHVSDDPVVLSKDPPVLYSQVAKKQREMKELSENNVHVMLEEEIKCTLNFNYWRGKWMDGQKREQICFVKTLNDECSLRNAFDFKQLAGSLSALRVHKNVVNILSTFTEKVPYAIYYEYMAFGTLRNILTSRYHQIIDKTSKLSDGMDLKGQIEELISFSYDIAEAMIYITTNDFSHPALSASKILLTENGRCKLYDIYPMEMAICKINEVMKKTIPPVAWLAPETIFLKEYSCASDMWNFAVLLWEIFSVGDIPYNGMTQEQVEQTIKQSIPLSQPMHCPGALYSIMLSCWVATRTERPTFENIRSQLLNTITS